MKLYSWNVNGIRAVLNKGTFQQFLEEHDPDVLCLQETKASRDQFELDLPYYEHFFRPSKKAIPGRPSFQSRSRCSIRMDSRRISSTNTR